MSKGSEKRNLKRSEDLSVFRITVLLVIGQIIDKPLVHIVIILYLLLDHLKNAIFYISMICLIFLYSSIDDFMPFGIIESKNRNHYLADAVFYKVKISDTTELEIGDIVLFRQKGQINDLESQIKKNVRFIHPECVKIFNLRPRKKMEDLISRLDEQNENTVRRILLDQYSDDLEFDLGYGLFSYYFLRALKRRNRKACICFLLFYVLFFGFQMKFFIIIADLLFDRFEIRKDERLSYKVMFFMILNKKLLQNRSILLPLLFESYGLFEFPFDFKTYLMVTASIFFGQSDLIDILFFDLFLKGRILLFCFSIFSALIPFMQVPFMYLARAYSYVNSLHINIRGCISVPTFLLFLELKKLIRNQNSLIELLAISFCILLPLYEPFFQVSFLNVGQGDSILIKYPFSHSCILIDTGPPYNYHLLQRELFRKGIYVIDHLIITHDDSDHNGNICSLYKDFAIRDIVIEGRNISYKSILFEYMDLGHFDNDNDNSLVYRLDVNGFDFLFTGDISSDAERVLIRRYGPIRADFLKVSHHGSRSASSDFFISRLLPEMAVISTSGLYEHPHQEVLDTLDRYHVSYYVTS